MRRTRMLLLPIALALLLAPRFFAARRMRRAGPRSGRPRNGKPHLPEDQGMNSAALAKLIDMGAYTGMDSILIARHGKIVAEAYYAPFKPGIRHRMYSATKSIVGTLIAIAIKDGLLDSVDHRVIDFFSDRQIANIADYKKSITVQDLLNMTSGLDWTPGESRPKKCAAARIGSNIFWISGWLGRRESEFQYNNGNPHLLSAILYKD